MSKQKSQELTSIHDAKAGLIRLAERMGFRYFIYVAGRSFAPQRGGHDIWANTPRIITQLPLGWTETYHKNDFGRIDPILPLTLKSRLPFVWCTDKLYHDATLEQRQFISTAHDFRVNRGLTIPVYGPFGDLALFSYISDVSEQEFVKLVASNGHNLYIASLYHHQIISKLKDRDQTNVSLTVRESEILIWTAVGKTMSEISTIIGISSKTVEFHIYNLMKKLDVYNKPQAVAKAITLGLISP